MIERGEPEGLVNHSSPSGSILNFPWVDFLVISILTFLLLEYLYGAHNPVPVIPFSYDILSSESELFGPEVINFDPINIPINWFAIGLMSAGAILLSGSIFLSYYHGHP